MSRTEWIEEGNRVFDDGVEVGNVSDKSIREAVALVIDGARGEARFGEEDGGELDNPAGLAGEAVDDAEDAEGFGGREWGPPLGEEPEAARVGDVLGGVTHWVAGVELVRSQWAE